MRESKRRKALLRSEGAQLAGTGRSRDDSELLLKASRGDKESFQELFSEHSDRVFNFVYHLTYSRDDAEDILQEAYIRVFAAIQGRDVSSFDFQAYLYKAAKNLSLKAVARRKREGLTLEEAADLADESIFQDPERAALLREQRARVAEATRKLSDDQETALLLREVEGLSYDSIAEVLDSNSNAVGVLLSRARLKFREVYRMSFAEAERTEGDCARITASLSRYIDGEATDDEVRLIESHLEACPICSGNLESMKEASTVYRSLIPIIPIAAVKASGALKVGPAVAKAASGATRISLGGAGITGNISSFLSTTAGKVAAAVTAAVIAAGGSFGIYSGLSGPRRYCAMAFERSGDIWVTVLDGRNKTVPETEVNLTRSPLKESEPCWSPDGRNISFVQTTADSQAEPAHDQIVTIESTGSDPGVTVAAKTWEKLVSEHTGVVGFYEYCNPRWLPDGTGLLYEMEHGASESDAAIMLKPSNGPEWQVAYSFNGNTFDISSTGVLAIRQVAHSGGYQGGISFQTLDGKSLRTDVNPDGSKIGVIAWLPKGDQLSAGVDQGTRFFESTGKPLGLKRRLAPCDWISDTIGIVVEGDDVNLVDFEKGSRTLLVRDAVTPRAVPVDGEYVSWCKKEHASPSQVLMRGFALNIK